MTDCGAGLLLNVPLECKVKSAAEDACPQLDTPPSLWQDDIWRFKRSLTSKDATSADQSYHLDCSLLVFLYILYFRRNGRNKYMKCVSAVSKKLARQPVSVTTTRWPSRTNWFFFFNLSFYRKWSVPLSDFFSNKDAVFRGIRRPTTVICRSAQSEEKWRQVSIKSFQPVRWSPAGLQPAPVFMAGLSVTKMINLRTKQCFQTLVTVARGGAASMLVQIKFWLQFSGSTDEVK